MLGNILNRLLRPLKSMNESLSVFALKARGLLPMSPGFLMTVALIALLLLSCSVLSGCAKQTKTVRPPLPAQAQARLVPDFSGSTNRDVVMYAIEVREGWLSCETDKGVWRRMHEAKP